MMRRFALALSIIAAMASPAWSATRYVAQTATGNGSGSDAANAQSIANFNSAAVAGDVALLLGTFTTLPIPARNGTMAQPIVYRNGNSSNDRNLVWFGSPLARVDFVMPGNSAARHLLWRDFSIRGRVYLGTSRAATPMSNIRMSNIRIIDGNFLAYRINDCKFDSLNLTITSAATRGGTFEFGRADKGADSVWYCSRDTVSNSSFSNQSAECTSAVDSPAASFLWCGRNMVYSSVRCSLTTTNHSTSGYSLRFSRVAQTVGGKMENCSFYGYWTAGGAGTDEPMTWTFKDGCRAFLVNNCSVVIDGPGHLPANPAYPFINFAQDEGDGTLAQACESIGSNVIRNSTFKNLTTSTSPITWYTNSTDGDSIAYNTFVCGPTGGITVNSYARGNGNAVDRVSTGNTVFDHNAFVTFDPNTPAFSFLSTSLGAEQSIKWTNNLFCNMAATTTGRGINFGYASLWGAANLGPVGNDYNVFYVPRATSRAQIAWRGASSVLTSVPGAPEWRDLRGANSLDAHSIYGPMVFVDSTLAGFDAHPKAGSAVLYGPDGFVGPFGVSGGADVTPPSGIIDLSTAPTSSTDALLNWTAPGDDGGSGTASAYDLRWSTATITEGTFASATPASGEPTPGPAGSAQSMTVSGLAAGTTCFFAIKTRDEAGNWSVLSTVSSAAMPAADNVRPAAVLDMNSH